MTAPAASGSITTRHLVTAIGIYAAARLALVVAVATLIIVGGNVFGREIDLFIAAVFAVLISMPVSLAVFARLRKRVNATITAFDAQRSAAHTIGEQA